VLDADQSNSSFSVQSCEVSDHPECSPAWCAVLLAHLRQLLPHAEEDAFLIDIHHPVPLCLSLLLRVIRPAFSRLQWNTRRL